MIAILRTKFSQIQLFKWKLIQIFSEVQLFLNHSLNHWCVSLLVHIRNSASIHYLCVTLPWCIKEYICVFQYDITLTRFKLDLYSKLLLWFYSCYKMLADIYVSCGCLVYRLAGVKHRFDDAFRWALSYKWGQVIAVRLKVAVTILLAFLIKAHHSKELLIDPGPIMRGCAATNYGVPSVTPSGVAHSICGVLSHSRPSVDIASNNAVRYCYNKQALTTPSKILLPDGQPDWWIHAALIIYQAENG